MSPTTHDDLEGRLRELFDRQAGAMHVTARAFDDPPMATVTTLAPAPAAFRRRRDPLDGRGGRARRRRRRDRAGTKRRLRRRSARITGALDLSTKQVSLAADAMAIEAGGHRFTAGGSTVDLNSDPGTPDKYTTLELAWTERASRCASTSTSPPTDTTGGQARSARTTASHPATGSSTPASTSAPRWAPRSPATSISRRPAPKATCTSRTCASSRSSRRPRARTRRASSRSTSPTTTSRCRTTVSSGFGLGEPTLLDTATCTPVADPHSFVFSLDLTTPGVAGIDAGNNRIVESQNDIDPSGSIQLSSVSAGSTIVHFAARERSTGTVVATADIPVVVG